MKGNPALMTTVTGAPGRRLGEVEAQIDRQANAVEDLRGALSELVGRLDSVLRSSEPGLSEVVDTVAMRTLIGQRLDSNNDSIEHATDRIREVLHRLEL